MKWLDKIYGDNSLKSIQIRDGSGQSTIHEVIGSLQ